MGNLMWWTEWEKLSWDWVAYRTLKDTYLGTDLHLVHSPNFESWHFNALLKGVVGKLAVRTEVVCIWINFPSAHHMNEFTTLNTNKPTAFFQVIRICPTTYLDIQFLYFVCYARHFDINFSFKSVLSQTDCSWPPLIITCSIWSDDTLLTQFSTHLLKLTYWRYLQPYIATFSALLHLHLTNRA